MKKIILIVGAMILLAVGGRAFWAYQQMKSDEVKVNGDSWTATTNPPKPNAVQAETSQPKAQVVAPSKVDTLTKLIETSQTDKEVVLKAWNTADKLSIDNRIKSIVANSRGPAELYYDSNRNSFAGVCEKAAYFSSAKNELNKLSNSVVCKDFSAAWAISVQLASNMSQYQCADYPNGLIVRNTPINTASCK